MSSLSIIRSSLSQRTTSRILAKSSELSFSAPFSFFIKCFGASVSASLEPSVSAALSLSDAFSVSAGEISVTFSVSAAVSAVVSLSPVSVSLSLTASVCADVSISISGVSSDLSAAVFAFAEPDFSMSMSGVDVLSSLFLTNETLMFSLFKRAVLYENSDLSSASSKPVSSTSSSSPPASDITVYVATSYPVSATALTSRIVPFSSTSVSVCCSAASCEAVFPSLSDTDTYVFFSFSS